MAKNIIICCDGTSNDFGDKPSNVVKLFSLCTFLVYVSSLVLYIVAKNKWNTNINLEHHEFDLYFELSLIFLATSILFRIYSIYHGSFSNWDTVRKQQQEDFNKQFSAGIK